MTRGVLIAAAGANAAHSATRLVRSLKRHHPELAVRVVTDSDRPYAAEVIPFEEGSGVGAARLVKLAMLEIVSWGKVAYLDADTEVLGNISEGFALLEGGADIAMCLSAHQGPGVFQHIGRPEVDYTIMRLGYPPLQYQAGVMFVRRNDSTAAFFRTWRAEWERYGQHDQAAFVRALHSSPCRVLILSAAFNGGEVIAHHFGAAR